MATKYFGWRSVPIGVLVRTRPPTDRNAQREFYIKTSDGFIWRSDSSTFVAGHFPPDFFTTGVYKTVNLNKKEKKNK